MFDIDPVYFWCFVIFLVILYLDHNDKKDKNIENFNNMENNTFNMTNKSSVNFSKTNLNFKNFGTNGQTPPYLKCPMCNLQFDCANYPYDIDEKNTNVCTTCIEKIYYDTNNYQVFARSAGRPRQARNIR